MKKLLILILIVWGANAYGQNTFQGLNNYSTNRGSEFTTRSIVDKGYIDSSRNKARDSVAALLALPSNIYVSGEALRLLNDSTIYLPVVDADSVGAVTPTQFNYWNAKVEGQRLIDSAAAIRADIGTGGVGAYNGLGVVVASKIVYLNKIGGAAADSIDLSCLVDTANVLLTKALAIALYDPQSTITDGSTQAVESNAIFDALALKQNLVTLTTTGTSGASTFNQSTGALNIPNYAGGSTAIHSVLSADHALNTVSTAQTAFPSTQDVFTLAANTTYEFEGVFNVTTAAGTSYSGGMGFLLGGGATLTSYSLTYVTWKSVENAGNTAQGTGYFTTATTVNNMNAASTIGGFTVRFKGIMRMNAGGTVTPEVMTSAAVTSQVMKANSYIKFTSLGSGTFTTSGAVN